MSKNQAASGRIRLGALLLAAAGLASTLSACAPLLIGGAIAGSAMVASDRRTAGTQLEDQIIETKAANRLRESVGDRAHVNATSYNRVLLLTGEARNEMERQAIERTVASIDNVKTVVNEIAVAGNSSLTSRSNDALLAGKVKATLANDGNVSAAAFKVVAERGIIYLMGRVTEREAQRAALLASAVPGVQRVVRVVEIVSDSELMSLQPRSAS
ncbi:BON domain-containing protein [Caldimonas tepidiphila]|uniref:BON domain-containing protein n=1 Tax=Caldimonas tepidiphila TaxID=2315841 RepID=UPI000E5C1CCF|nr:BON domain-containing protein [Caldimonas tepidiphila]